LQNTNNVNPSSSSSYNLPYSLLDPNPSLINQHGNINDNISLIASIKTCRNGTIADGVSKLILVVDSNNPLQFSINGTKSDDLTNGTLSSLNQSNVDNLRSTANVIPKDIGNVRSVVAAVYTPPDSFNQDKGSNRTIDVNVSDPNNPAASAPLEIPIQLYRPPVVLIHGVWTNSEQTWASTAWTATDPKKTPFTKSLDDKGFTYTFADYEKHNSETFDPDANKTFGNYGINATRNAIHDILEEYHKCSIAASQVDVVAHSMGGLMARGFVQQPDYKGKENYMKGSIHRLITIGTPHSGGHLSKILYDHRDDWYCLDGIQITPARTCKVEPKKLRTIYADFKTPIDKGAVEALVPGSDAYSHLGQTNVKSYAIAGSWKSNAPVSHQFKEWEYKIIKDDLAFNLDGKDGFNDENDLVVSVKSQLGGLLYQIRQPETNNPPNEENIPNKSAVYPNTVHANFLIRHDTRVFSETYSSDIQRDVIALLNSSDDNKFANAIGDGSPRHPSNIE
jgi:pimeloyl-ACP methyl ester carboxylesterase